MSPRRRPQSLAVPITWCWCAAATLAAQKPTAEDVRPAPTSRDVWIALDRYDTATSRRAFAACDQNGDDRLDVREARRSLTNMGEVGELGGFRRLDTDRNGFVHWNEFDARFRRIVERGDPFLFRSNIPFRLPVYKVAAPVEPDADLSALGKVMVSVEKDKKPGLNRAEFAKLIQELQLPKSTEQAFPALDTDGSGSVSEKELEPVMRKVPQLLESVGAAAVSKSGGLSVAALEVRLGRLAPSLRRFSAEIFRAADRDGNGRLQDEELPPKK